MRRLSVLAALVIAVLLTASAAQAKKVPTTPSITGAVYTTVDTNPDNPNYATQCHNGNPAVNCNQYSAKQYVYLNGGPTHNSLSPDGVYFYAVLAPGGQPNPNDGSAGNLSDDYDCYQNRLIQITGGEVSGVYNSSDPSCFHNTAVLPVGTGHRLDSPFVQLWPYADTPNPGGVYIMAVCYLGPTPTTPLPAGGVDPNSCKYDAFKVVFDTTPPTCKLVSSTTSGGVITSITVAVQDAGAGLESIVYNSTNANVTYPTPLVVGQLTPWYITATKIDLTQGASLSLTAVNSAGRNVFCDPAYGARRAVHLRTVSAGQRINITELSSAYTKMSLVRLGRAREAVVAVNGHRFALVNLTRQRVAHLNLGSALLRHHGNVVTVSLIGSKGMARVRISS
jgi:hypothetical protein